MKALIPMFVTIQKKVKFFFSKLGFNKLTKNKTGRPLKLPAQDAVALSVYKQRNGIPTKKAVFEIFEPEFSYKTMVVNMNRFVVLALLILKTIMQINKLNSHIIKHTDSTDIPVCLNKNVKHHQTMKVLASWGRNSKGKFFGLRLHKTDDLLRKMLSFKLTGAKTDERKVFLEINHDLSGLFVADAGYVSCDLAQEFYQEDKRILFAKPRKNMKKIISEFDYHLYNTRIIIELSFRNLKMFYNLITSLPRSVNGYLANYIYSLLAYCIA